MSKPLVTIPRCFGVLIFLQLVALPCNGTVVTGVFNERPVPSPVAEAREIVRGPDAWWFTEFSTNRIGRYSHAGEIVEFTIPTPNSGPLGIASDFQAVWFTEFNANKIGRITPDGSVTEFSIPTPSSGPVGIAVVNGSVWFSESNANKIGQLTAAGTFTEIPIPTPNSQPMGLASYSDTLWFAEFQGNKIGKISVRAGLVVDEMPIPTPSSGPSSLSSDGLRVWFTETAANKIGVLAPEGISEFSVPTPNSGLSGIVGFYYSDIAWFTERRANKIGFVTKDGRFTEYPVPTRASEPVGITGFQVEGQVIFTEQSGNAIARFQSDAVVVLAAQDIGGWSTEFDIANVEEQTTILKGSLLFPRVTVCAGPGAPELRLSLGPHAAVKANTSQTSYGPSFGAVFFRSLVDGVLPIVKARLINPAAASKSIDLPPIRLSTLAALDPSVLVFPGATKIGGAHSNLLISEVATLSFLRVIPDTDLRILVEAFSNSGQLVGNASFTVGYGSSLYLVDILGQLGVTESSAGQIRVTKTGGEGMMWAT